jgi:dihydropteroate synthase
MAPCSVVETLDVIEDIGLCQLDLQSDILPLLRTSVDEPSSLTDEEIDRLDTYLALAMQNQLSVATMRDTYGLAAAEATIEVQAADIVDSFFLSRFG